MQSVTFIGEVRQGRLYPSGPLAEFDGKQVLVTVIAPDASLTPAVPEATRLARKAVDACPRRGIN
jgi:hypothetical protein